MAIVSCNYFLKPYSSISIVNVDHYSAVLLIASFQVKFDSDFSQNVKLFNLLCIVSGSYSATFYDGQCNALTVHCPFSGLIKTNENKSC